MMIESLPMKTRLSIWMLALATAATVPALMMLGLGCSTGEPQKDFKQGQPPVVVVQAPGNTASKDSKGDSSYAGLAWEAATSGAVGESVEEVEPYDVVSLLREFEPAIIDPASDQDGEKMHRQWSPGPPESRNKTEKSALGGAVKPYRWTTTGLRRRHDAIGG